jgi:hypothetical protein
VIVTPLEIKGAVAGLITSVLILAATFVAGGIYRNYAERETEVGNKPLDAATLAARGRTLSFKAVLTAMVKMRMEARTRQAY